jgi:hypothetical protein
MEEVGVTQDRGGSGFSKSEVTWTVVTWTQVKLAGLSWVEGGGSILVEEVGVSDPGQGRWCEEGSSVKREREREW